ncbi:MULTISPECIES: tail fiber protein [unclassified Ensifer]|uniref:tail fiber protein n=1 Tax=unclassified Ensifer TaxID=2633371 RepID=UPI0008138A5B|nr:MULTISPECIES: tail fiber protein [unclassified Ensifer]OCP17430.1 hypothetical protein BC361_08205 [Ensifer sp. LC54]OCP28664.1 hypothetical protein BC363_02150 [Ensifer sp. LC384]
MAKTEHYELEKPDEARNVNDEFLTLRITLDQLDGILWAISQAVAGKAADGHGHTMEQITGLTDALNAKMAASKTFKYDDLTDVDGATDAPVGYVLVKRADGTWTPSSAAAAIGAHGHAQSDIAGLGSALGGKVAKAGDTMSGDLAVPALFATSGNIHIDSAGNRHLWYRSNVGVNRGLLYHEHTDGSMRLQMYDTSGAYQNALIAIGSGLLQWTGYLLEINGDRSADNVESRAWSGAQLGHRHYYGADGRYHLQKTTNNGGSWTTLLRYEADGKAWFDLNRLYAPHGIHTDSTSTHGLLPGNGDAATLATQNMFITSWWGIGLRCSMDNTTRIAFDTRDGRILATNHIYLGQAGAETRFQYDGNIVWPGSSGMSVYGISLHDALGKKAAWNNQSSHLATGYPIGAMIAVYTNGVQFNRNSLISPALSSADDRYFRVVGQSQAGAALDGLWRACGHIGNDYVEAQRIG